jgi:gas vesicle protein
MGIQSIIGDVKSSVGNQINSFLEEAWGAVSGLKDQVGTYVSNIWSGGFAGVSNFEELKSAIDTYSADVDEIIEKYDASADLSVTFQGKAGEELTEFVNSTKSLLMAYGQLVKKWKDELNDAYEKYQSGDTTLSSNVSQDAQDVAAAAQKVDIG